MGAGFAADRKIPVGVFLPRWRKRNKVENVTCCRGSTSVYRFSEANQALFFRSYPIYGSPQPDFRVKTKNIFID